MSPTTSSRQRSTGEAAMGKRSRHSANNRMVSASELAQMGRCERLVMFEHRHGSRRTARQQRARERGMVEHERFYREGLAASAPAARKGRCFIATCVFGEGWQTLVLRGFRDVALRSNAWGRRVIWFYYRVAPSICKCLRRWPALQAPVRVVLGAMAACLRWWPGLRGGGQCRR
ncbi:CFI-box-CTERM domain-containing protein [Thauera sp. SWB20]|uniref:CFI-box-CTERM domain-containing protein n=1 Tax=Thauera sp. SWB20 TaxID=1572758 RepID=UPI003FCE49C3